MTLLREGDLVWPKKDFDLDYIRSMRIVKIEGDKAKVQIVTYHGIDYKYFQLSELIYAQTG